MNGHSVSRFQEVSLVPVQEVRLLHGWKEMDLAEGFRNHGEKIVNKWVEYALSTYSSSGFFKKEKDRFANPVGGTIRRSFTTLFEQFSTGADPQEFVAPLRDFIAIRAVQEFSPSQAVSPIHAVKHITREVFEADGERKHLVSELYDFEFAVDMAVLAAFDLYMQYRERLYQVRIEEIRSGSHILTDSTCPSKLLSTEKGLEVLDKG